MFNIDEHHSLLLVLKSGGSELQVVEWSLSIGDKFLQERGIE